MAEPWLKLKVIYFLSHWLWTNIIQINWEQSEYLSYNPFTTKWEWNDISFLEMILLNIEAGIFFYSQSLSS